MVLFGFVFFARVLVRGLGRGISHIHIHTGFIVVLLSIILLPRLCLNFGLKIYITQLEMEYLGTLGFIDVEYELVL